MIVLDEIRITLDREADAKKRCVVLGCQRARRRGGYTRCEFHTRAALAGAFGL